MQVFIAGATGTLGRHLTQILIQRGHQVVGLARSAEKADAVRRLAGRPVIADLFDPDALARAAEGSEVVIHAATSIPVGPAARNREAWEANDEIRRRGTASLALAAGRIGARRYLQQSVAWVFSRKPGEPRYDESTRTSPPRLLESAVDGERLAREAGARFNFSVGILRPGTFYGADTAHSRMMANLLRRRRLPIPGRGDWLVAPVHVRDAAQALALAAETDRPGIWHVVDDEPVPFADLIRRFAAVLRAPAPRRAPLWLARLLLGTDTFEAMTTSMNTSNLKTRRELGWVPLLRNYREGLAAMAEELAERKAA